KNKSQANPNCPPLQFNDGRVVRGYIFAKEVAHPFPWVSAWRMVFFPGSSGLHNYRWLLHQNLIWLSLAEATRENITPRREDTRSYPCLNLISSSSRSSYPKRSSWPDNYN